MQKYSGDRKLEDVLKKSTKDSNYPGRTTKINPWLTGQYYTVSLVRHKAQISSGAKFEWFRFFRVLLSFGWCC